MSFSNNAVFLTAKNAPMVVQKSTYTPPRENEIVVKNRAVAINQYDWIIQAAPNLVVSWVKLPFIFGTDVAGEIVAIGKSVTRFNVGDRVVATAVGFAKNINRAPESGFQEYTVVRPDLTAPIPQDMSYETACVLPLGIATAACALFLKGGLALPHPSTSPPPSGKTLLIWGGSTSVGCNAIQLARAAGYDVIATASPKNHEYLKNLGAVEVFDYHSKKVVQEITAAFKNRTCAGAVSIGRGAIHNCVDIVSDCTGDKKVALVTFDLPPFPKSGLGLLPFIVRTITTMMFTFARAAMKGVSIRGINAGELLENGIGKGIFEDFLPKALAQQTFVPGPPPQVVGHGLENVQKAIDMSKKGISGKKLVVTL